MDSATGEDDKLSSSTSAQPCRRFSIAEIQSATKDFDEELVIGRGGFGKVYRGLIWSEETRHVVAIKRLDSISNQGAQEFRAEIEMLSKLRHCHLVSLIGFCDHQKEMILVYEYMPHGTLCDHLHKADTPLNWLQRLKIAIGAARGLDYLHTGFGTQHGVIHRDVKSSNILLDENWAAMISDFGLSKISPTNQSFSYVDASVKGTFGYLDPEYFYTRRLTRKTDVFAFGVVLFELLSGRHAVDTSLGDEQCSLVRWAQKCVKERRIDQMVDSNIRGTIFPKCLRRFAQIADRCLHSRPKERPTMAEVVVSLQAILELQKKCDNSAESSGINGFPWKIHKYFVSATKQNSDQSGASLPKSHESNMNQLPSTNNDGSRNFEDYLRSGASARLPLVTKVKIALGIARGFVSLYETQQVSCLNRHNILLDKDFTAKFSNYGITESVSYHDYFKDCYDLEDCYDSRDCYYYPGFQPFSLRTNPAGFIVVFAEVLTGEKISNENEFEKIDGLFLKHGKMSLSNIAKSCYEMCNEVDSESKMLRILEEYEKYI